MFSSIAIKHSQFNIRHLFAPSYSIWPIDKTLSGGTTLAESEPGSNDNEEVFHISKAESTPLDCLMLYPVHSLQGPTYLQRSSLFVLQSQPTGLNLLGFYRYVKRRSLKKQSYLFLK